MNMSVPSRYLDVLDPHCIAVARTSCWREYDDASEATLDNLLAHRTDLPSSASLSLQRDEWSFIFGS